MNKTLEYMTFGKAQVMFDLKEGRASAGDAARYSLLWTPLEFDLASAREAIRMIDRLGRRAYITLNVPYPQSRLDTVCSLACSLIDAGAHAWQMPHQVGMQRPLVSP